MSRLGLAGLLLACAPTVSVPAEDGGGETSTSTTSIDPSTTISPATSSPIDTTTGDSTHATFNVDSSSSDDPFPGFIEVPDGICGLPPEGTLHHCSDCDVWSQDCPRGDKCTPWANDGSDAWNATRCAPIDPDEDAPGDACTIEATPASGLDTCAADSMCWDVDPSTLEGQCVAFCQGSQNNPLCSDASTQCLIANEGVLILCLPTCDPLAATPCGEGESCHPSDEIWFCLPDDAAVEINGLTPTLCEPGTTAIDPASQSFCDPKSDLCCAQICDVTAPACAPPYECTPLAKTGNAGLCSDAG